MHPMSHTLMFIVPSKIYPAAFLFNSTQVKMVISGCSSAGVHQKRRNETANSRWRVSRGSVQHWPFIAPASCSVTFVAIVSSHRVYELESEFTLKELKSGPGALAAV